MSYRLDFLKQAENDIDYHRKSGNKSILKKISVLLKEISKNPYTGTGKPEALKHDFSGLWSRRINREHRLVYEIMDEKILIHSARGHYK